MNLPVSETLDIKYLSRLFDNKSESYKLFWFKAIMGIVAKGRTSVSYEELVDAMIGEAWYMVTEYHLNLGPADTLESLVHYLSRISGLKSSEEKETILEFVRNCEDKNVSKMKRTLTKNVPYRLQAPFYSTLRGQAEWNTSERNLIRKIRQEKRLIYYIGELSGLDTRIEIQDEWFPYLYENQEILSGWINFNLITYLQKRNPNVPGISDKLNAPQERKMEKAKAYWKLVAEIEPLKEIYGNQLVAPREISLDHFIPWSYVANDELWNLHPTTKSINSSKGNFLPDWDRYFHRLADVEFHGYQSVWKYEKIHQAFDKCCREHVNSADVRYRLYREGLEFEMFKQTLKEIMLPVYQAVHNMGFRNWVYREADK